MQEFDGEKAAAQYIDMSVSWLRKRRLLGLPPEYKKLGRRVVYSRTELDRFLSERTVRPRRNDRSEVA
jgi:hypothetical protein